MNENKMGIMPVNKLLRTMAAPMVLSMLIGALYNVVDSQQCLWHFRYKMLLLRPEPESV